MSRNRRSRRVHPIIRQIIDRDCHVSLSGREVVRHVIAKLKEGYETFREMPKRDRRQLIEDCLAQHQANRGLYARVMSGSSSRRPPARSVASPEGPLTGADVRRLMRQHHVTFGGLAFKLGVTEKRVRQVRQQGLANLLAVRDWLEAIRGEDPGPLPERYRIRRQAEESACGFCGCPLFLGEEAFEYVGEVFCSTHCCRKSRGWS